MNDDIPRPVLVSGVQANGDLHLGNLIGAIDQWVGLLTSHRAFVFLADLHALTTPRSTSTPLRDITRSAAALYVAAGLDPAKCHIYRQSDLAAYHTELAWYLTCVTPLGQLQRMTQYKAKSEQQKKEVGAGLLTYPVLQAADIALYDADVVPVGDDQRQHIELTRDIVETFNRRFSSGAETKPLLVVPRAQLPTVGARVLGLDDPTAKMSKSLAHGHPGHAVFLLDEPAVARKKIMRAVTDSDANLDYETASPSVRNLIEIGAAMSAVDDPVKFVEGHGLQSYGQLKTAVADAVVERIEPIQSNYHELMAHPDRVEEILQTGATTAGKIAEATITRVRHAQGL